MLDVKETKQFKKSIKKYANKKDVIIELRYVLSLLIEEKTIPEKYKDHKLKGTLIGTRELHIKPDVLLLYVKDDKSIARNTVV